MHSEIEPINRDTVVTYIVCIYTVDVYFFRLPIYDVKEIYEGHNGKHQIVDICDFLRRSEENTS